MRRFIFALSLIILLSLPARAQDAPTSLTPETEPPTPISVDADPVEDEGVADSNEALVIPGSMLLIEGEQIYLPMVHGKDLEQAVISMAAVMPAPLPDFGPFDPSRIPIELQSWWMPAYGHVHAAVMIPFGQQISGMVDVPVRVVLHNNPGELFMFRVDDEQSTRMKMPLSLRCPTTICAWSFTIPLDTTRFPNGWRMFRFRAQVKTPDNKIFTTSSDIPMLVSNGDGGSNALRFGSTNYLVGKGWYEGFDYTNPAIEHVPTKPVAGLLALRIQVHKGGSNLVVDLDKSHFLPAVGPWPMAGDTPGVPLLNIASEPGQWRDIIIDTRPLADGWHSIQVRTDNPKGAVSKCTGCPAATSYSSGVAKFWFYVDNGGGTPEPTLVPGETPIPPTAVITPTDVITPTETSVITPTQPVETPIPPTETPVIVVPTATPIILPTLPPAEASTGLWISAEEVRALPMSGAAWSAVLGGAAGSCTPDLNNQDSPCNVNVLAEALVFARTGDESYRTKVVAAVRSIVGTQSETGGRTLALGRELVAYVAAADLISLSTHDAALHEQFRARLSELLGKTLDGRTLRSTHEDRANNWGTMACASRVAIAVYIGDATELENASLVFRGWLGDLSAYSSLKFGDLGWQSDPSKPVGVNPVGAMKNGYNIDGALPEEMRRGGAFKMPPSPTGYAWGGLSGIIACAEIMHRAGYPAYEWQSKGLLRAVQFLHGLGWEAVTDDAWSVAVINLRYGTNYPVNGTSPGKNMGWTQWTHQGGVVASASLMIAEEEAKLATGESMGDLQDEIDTLARYGWRPVGEVRTVETPDDDVLYAQDMVRD